MKSTTIISGNFSAGKNSKGNFTGYNASGQQIFISKAMINNIGIVADKDFKTPIYALIGERIITPNDENGNPMPPVARLQAFSVYKTSAELIAAKTADLTLEIEERKVIEDAVTSADLSEASVNALLSASSLF
jgi:hypothetical protein